MSCAIELEVNGILLGATGLPILATLSWGSLTGVWVKIWPGWRRKWARQELQQDFVWNEVEFDN